VVKKLRKQSHVKPNSIDRSHVIKKDKSNDKIKIKPYHIIQPYPEQKPKKSSEHSQMQSFDNKIKDSFENNIKNLNDNFKGSQFTSGNSQ